MPRKLTTLSKVSLLVLAAGLTAGCATTGQLEEVRKIALDAQSKANSAQSAAQSALATANDAKASADNANACCQNLGNALRGRMRK